VEFCVTVVVVVFGFTQVITPYEVVVFTVALKLPDIVGKMYEVEVSTVNCKVAIPMQELALLPIQ